MTSKDPQPQSSQPNKNPFSPTVNLSTLPIPQLTSIKTQLTQELQHLTTSFTQLRAAQAKFKDCIKSIRDGIEKPSTDPQNPPATLLVPLTPSLYVPGTLASTETVLVDIGTGFYIEKTPPSARNFYTSKISQLAQNLQDLEIVVQGKQGNLTVVEDVLRQKMISESTGSGGGEGGKREGGDG
ncbi:MAG: hypothetical protein Q9182_005651 [Xanthomendoza sp. 2 TL-2023]